MNIIRRIGAISLIVVLFFGLSACKDKDSTSEMDDPATKEPDEISGDISVWAWELEADYLNSIVDQFNEEYPNVNVEINKQGPDQVFQRLVSGLASGQEDQLPDLVQVQDAEIPSFTEKFPDSFANLSDIGFNEHDGSFAVAKEEMIKDDDGNYIAFPRDLGPVGMFYRKDIFNDAGVDAESIETWDDYIEAGKKIKEETDTAMLGLALNDDIPLTRFMIHQQESFYFDSDGNLNAGSDETLNALTKIKEIVDNDITENVTNADGLTAAMKNGEVATIPNSVWYNGTMYDQAPELSGDWGTFPLPKFKESGVHAANSGGSSFAIPEGSNNKEAAYVFGEFLSTDVDNQIVALEEYGLFPSLEESYEQPEFTEGNEYFDGEKFYENFADIAVEIPEVTYTADYPEVNDNLNEEVASMILNDENPADVIDKFVKKVESSTGEKDKN
ncbi:MAG TPA: extracellular solute-binding protein [Candidatus Dormibacteraeota bacterium]|nr:extracellular solute-binding protein [Candidatus Dormibacteraeota bacterium]